VWSWRDEEIVHDDQRQRSLTAELDLLMERSAVSLLERWKDEPPPVRRALVWLLGAMPELHERFADLVEAELPNELAGAWRAAARGPASQEESDELHRFEQWALDEA
jgi:hypothetical protein